MMQPSLPHSRQPVLAGLGRACHRHRCHSPTAGPPWLHLPNLHTLLAAPPQGGKHIYLVPTFTYYVGATFNLLCLFLCWRFPRRPSTPPVRMAGSHACCSVAGPAVAWCAAC